MPLRVEICVEGIRNARAAERGCADRVELCENLAVGGVTPSIGAIAAICREARIPVHVLIRPRAGDFLYDSDEFEAVLHDVKAAQIQGATGVVLGMLDSAGRIDAERLREVRECADALSVTFHRAFDVVPDPAEALETLVTLGVDRVLTSGRIGAARESLDMLAALARQARGRITILAGGSVNMGDFASIAAAGITEIHVGSAACSAGLTDPELVRALVEAARRC